MPAVPDDGARVSSIPLAGGENGTSQCPVGEHSRQGMANPHRDHRRAAEEGKKDEAANGSEEAAATHWMYPSRDAFRRAMARKGHPQAEKLGEEDMHRIVSIHNMINERAWAEIREFEALHHTECPCGPKLVRFRGRADAPSPKARLRRLVGYTPPFDRHDWVVDRCGAQVRYIADFYEGKAAGTGSDGKGGGFAAGLPLQSVYLDVRPALTLGGAWDRLRVQAAWLLGFDTPKADVVFADHPPDATRTGGSAQP
jgi:cytochrome c heme-lyase